MPDSLIDVAELRYFRVVNFSKFQHYRDRDPPWIKLYNRLLDNYEFNRLSDSAKFHLVGIWMLASRNKNRLPWDAKWIRQRVSANTNVDLENLLHNGFIELYEFGNETHEDLPVKTTANAQSKQSASKVLHKGGTQSREREETEKRREEKKENKIVLPENLNMDAWYDWLEHRKRNNYPTYKTNKIAKKLATLSHDKQQECVDSSIEQEYRGLFPQNFTNRKSGNAVDTFNDLRNQFDI